MRQSAKVATTVNISEVFPDMSPSVSIAKTLMQMFNVNEALLWCGMINKALYRPNVSDKARQSEIVANLLSDKEARILGNVLVASENERIPFHRGQVLVLAKMACMFCSSGPQRSDLFTNPELKSRIYKSLLIAGEFCTDYLHRDWVNTPADGVLRDRSLMGSVRRTVEMTRDLPALEKIVGRGWMIFHDHLANMSSFEGAFQESVGIQFADYYNHTMAIIINSVSGSGAAILDSTVLKSRMRTFDSFLTLASIDIVDFQKEVLSAARDCNTRLDSEYLSIIRKHPLIICNNGKLVIIDPTAMVDSAISGALFRIEPRDERSKYLSLFGSAFEKYTIDILRQIFPKTVPSLNRLEVNYQLGSDAEIDAIIDDHQEIFVFEIKSSWVREDKILTNNPSEYIEELQKKYVVSGNGKRSPKGIGQLSKIVQLLTARKSTRKGRSPKDTVIFPILVVRDNLLTVPLHTEFFASEFSTLLDPKNEAKVRYAIVNGFNIAPLVLLTIDDIEDLEASQDNIGMTDAIKQYSQRCIDRRVSFRTFLSESEYANKLIHSKSMAGIGEKVLRSVQPLFSQNNGGSAL